jgi:hypothetical protein
VAVRVSESQAINIPTGQSWIVGGEQPQQGGSAALATTTAQRGTSNGTRAPARPAPRALEARLARRRRELPLVLAGVLLDIGGALAFADTSFHLASRREVLVATRPLGAVQLLSSGDLSDAAISGASGMGLVASSAEAYVIGRPLAVPLVAGAPLTTAELGMSSAVAAGLDVVALLVRPGGFPPALASGARVEVVAVPAIGSVTRRRHCARLAPPCSPSTTPRPTATAAAWSPPSSCEPPMPPASPSSARPARRGSSRSGRRRERPCHRDGALVGATTLALGLAATWPADRPVLPVEADPAGGTLAAAAGFAPEPGLVSLAAAARRSSDTKVVLEHTQLLPGGAAVLSAPGVPSRPGTPSLSPSHRGRADRAPRRARLRRAARLRAPAAAPRRRGDSSSGSANTASFLAADLALLATRPRLSDLQAATRLLAEPTLSAAADSGRLRLVLAGDGPYRDGEASQPLRLEVAARLPVDPEAAEGICHLPASARHLRRTPLVRALRDGDVARLPLEVTNLLVANAVHFVVHVEQRDGTALCLLGARGDRRRGADGRLQRDLPSRARQADRRAVPEAPMRSEALERLEECRFDADLLEVPEGHWRERLLA